jgi:oligopeptide transport system permease protein
VLPGMRKCPRPPRFPREVIEVTAYILRRLLLLIPVLFFVATITFFLMHQVPGGPFTQDRPLPPAVEQNLNHKYHLDKPVFTQYALYLRDLLHGDLGESFSQRGRSVTSIVRREIKPTAELGIFAFITASVIGISLGATAAFNQNRPIDYLCVFFSTIGASFPNFIIAAFLIIFFAVKLHWFKIIGWGSWQQDILPVISLSFLPASYISRITRASVLEVIRQDYVRTARAKGLHEQSIDLRHILRNSLIPILTLLGPIFAGLVSGSFIIETVFSIPGIGRETVGSIANRDYGLIMGTTLLYAFLIVMANLIVDVLYAVVDPRIRYS